MAWYQKYGDLPYQNEWQSLKSSEIFPNQLWRQINNDIPYSINHPQVKTSEILPSTVWQQKKGELPYTLFAKEKLFGSFCYAMNLTSIQIPKSVKKIGPYAFTYTSLKEVTIASDCTYSETTFPKDCIINFYPDILMDNNKNILYTNDNEIVYTKLTSQ